MKKTELEYFVSTIIEDYTFEGLEVYKTLKKLIEKDPVAVTKALEKTIESYTEVLIGFDICPECGGTIIEIENGNDTYVPYGNRMVCAVKGSDRVCMSCEVQYD